MKILGISVLAATKLGICAALLLCGSFVHGQDAVAAAESGPTNSIRGSILEAGTNQPLAEVPVRIVRLQPATAASGFFTKSGSDGSFELAQLPIGIYLVTPEPLPGYSSGQPANSCHQVVLRQGSATPTLRFYMAREKTIKGRVTDEDGKAISGASVKAFSEVSDPQLGVERLMELASATTDVSGGYVLQGLSGNGFTLMATPPPAPVVRSGHRISRGQTGLISTYWPSEPAIESAIPVMVSVAGAHDINIALRRSATYSIAGKTERYSGNVDVKHQPTSVSVTPIDFHDMDLTALSRTIRVSQDGSFRFDGLSAGTYIVQWTGPNLGDLLASQSVVLGGASNDVEIVLHPNRNLSLHGKITGDGIHGPELSGILLQFLPISPGLNGVVPVEAHPDAEGEISVTGLAPIQYFLRIMAAGRAYVKEVRMGSQEITSHVLDLSASSRDLSIVLHAGGGSVNGSVQGSENEEAGNAPAVLLFSDQFPAEKPSVVFVQARRFSIGPLAPGRYYAVAVESYDPNLFAKPGFRQQISRKMLAVDVAENQDATINLYSLSEREILTAAMQVDLF